MVSLAQAMADAKQPAHDAAAYWRRQTDAIADVSGPVATLHLGALRHNALDMAVRAAGVPIRVASKSVRVREAIDATLALPGYAGILAFTLPARSPAISATSGAAMLPICCILPKP